MKKNTVLTFGELLKIFTSGIIMIIFIVLLISCKKDDKIFPQAKPCPDMPTVKYGGEVYPTVQIGNQCWMAKNLNIGRVIDSGRYMKNDSIIEKSCYHNASYFNDTINCTLYGGLYQWDEVMQYANNSGAKGICPEGWHIPTNREIGNLMIYVDGNAKYLKTWGDEKNEYFNSTGFTSVPSGRCEDTDDGYFLYDNLGWSAHYWSSAELDPDNALSFSFAWHNDFETNFDNKKDAFSVRCIKD